MKRVTYIITHYFMHMHSNSSQKLHCKFTGWKNQGDGNSRKTIELEY